MHDELLVEPKTYGTGSRVNYLNPYIPLIQDKALSNAKRAQEYQKTFYDEGQKVNHDFKMALSLQSYQLVRRISKSHPFQLGEPFKCEKWIWFPNTYCSKGIGIWYSNDLSIN